MRMSGDTISGKGFEIKSRQSSRHPAEYLTDSDFADDIALMSNSLLNAQCLLQSQPSNCVYLNESKTECVNKCISDSEFVIKFLNNTLLKIVSDYSYLGSYLLIQKGFYDQEG